MVFVVTHIKDLCQYLPVLMEQRKWSPTEKCENVYLDRSHGDTKETVEVLITSHMRFLMRCLTYDSKSNHYYTHWTIEHYQFHAKHFKEATIKFLRKVIIIQHNHFLEFFCAISWKLSVNTMYSQSQQTKYWPTAGGWNCLTLACTTI